jgi:L,D-transpeptidase ErfK/SrfK
MALIQKLKTQKSAVSTLQCLCRHQGNGLLLPVALATALAMAVPTQALAISAPLRPGRLVGSVHTISAPAGVNPDLLASYYGVHPNRLQPLDSGKLRLDQRRIEPEFYGWVNGIVLNVPEAHVYWLANGKLGKSYPVGVSRSSWQVPLGRTQVVNKTQNPTWFVPESIQRERARQGLPVREQVPPGPENPLGSRWIGFANGKYGFHGTTDPASIKNYESHGCVRMLESHVQDLYNRVRVGTPVRIYYQPVKLAVAGQQIWLASYPDIYNLSSRGRDPRAMVRELATQAGVSNRINWQAVDRAIKAEDGRIVNVARSGS